MLSINIPITLLLQIKPKRQNKMVFFPIKYYCKKKINIIGLVNYKIFQNIMFFKAKKSKSIAEFWVNAKRLSFFIYTLGVTWFSISEALLANSFWWWYLRSTWEFFTPMEKSPLPVRTAFDLCSALRSAVAGIRTPNLLHTRRTL